MPTLTEIIRRDPPVKPPPGPTTALDALILQVLQDGERRELREITAALSVSTHKAHARIQTLVGKGLVNRTRLPGGPARGPGASVYQIARR
jgi:DNA-binding Lrp family transcriptional regulator